MRNRDGEGAAGGAARLIGEFITPDAGQSASAWFAAQTYSEQQSILSELYKIHRDLVEKDASGIFKAKGSKVTIGYSEELQSKLPTEDEVVKTVTVQDEDGEFSEFSIKKRGEKYFLVEGGQVLRAGLLYESANKIL